MGFTELLMCCSRGQHVQLSKTFQSNKSESKNNAYSNTQPVKNQIFTVVYRTRLKKHKDYECSVGQVELPL